MHGRRVLGVTSEQASDRFAIDPKFPEDSGRILAEPRCVLRRKGLGGFAHSAERDRWAGDPHRPTIGMLGLDDRPEMTDLFIVEHLVEGVDPSHGDTERVERGAHLGDGDVGDQGVHFSHEFVDVGLAEGGCRKTRVGVKRCFPPDREQFDRAIAHENDRHRAVGGLKRGEPVGQFTGTTAHAVADIGA